MVNVIADNQKLLRRATQIVADIAGVDAARAAQALQQARGEVKPAILIALGHSTEDAERKLDQVQGRLSALGL